MLNWLWPRRMKAAVMSSCGRIGRGPGVADPAGVEVRVARPVAAGDRAFDRRAIGAAVPEERSGGWALNFSWLSMSWMMWMRGLSDFDTRALATNSGGRSSSVPRISSVIVMPEGIRPEPGVSVTCSMAPSPALRNSAVVRSRSNCGSRASIRRRSGRR
jgi:hypothetical protein